MERSNRRQLLIRIEPEGTVHVSVPLRCPQGDVEKFLLKKTGWILRKSQEQRVRFEQISRKKFADGQDFFFLGRKYPLSIAAGGKACIDFDGQQWLVRMPSGKGPENIKAMLIAWYRTQAEEMLAGRVFHYSRIMGLQPDIVRIRTQKRLWGSCDQNKRAIHLNWQLIMSPLSVIDYVVVHELCHLKIADHSRRFWREVAKIVPDYKIKHRWLKDNAWDMALPEQGAA